MRRFLIALTVPVIASFASGCSDPGAPTHPDPTGLDGPSLAKPFGSPVLDGVISINEYANGASTTFLASLPGGGTTSVTAYFTHDATNLYMAMVIDRQSGFLSDIIAFEFDNDNDGLREDGDDIALGGVSLPAGTVFPGGDFYRLAGGAQNQSDAVDNGTIVVDSVFGVPTTGTVGVFELRKTLDSADDAHDFSIDATPPQTVGVLMQVSLEGAPDSFYPSFTTYCALTIGKKTTTLNCPA